MGFRDGFHRLQGFRSNKKVEKHCSMDPGMWIAEVPILSDTPLVPFKSFGG